MILRCGVNVWNRWRRTNPGVTPIVSTTDLEFVQFETADLRGANLKNADLRNAVLEFANLEDADLGNADLGNANLWGANLGNANLKNAVLADSFLGKANLEDANLENANLGFAKLGSANLRGANLEKANLGNAILEDADLENADLKQAILLCTHFHDLDLREVKGIEEVDHLTPSPLSPQALKKSQGQIPESFLKGCGLQDWEILAARLHDPNLRPDQVMDIGYQVLHNRATSPIVPLSVFISYSHEDTSVVEKLETRFDEDGIRYWRDVHDLKAGPIEHQVDRAIGMQRATLLVLSEDSVDSDWVEFEVEHARKAEKKRQEEGRGDYLLCPIALDDSWEKCRWPERILGQIKKYNILDFSRWGSDEEFEKVYEKLKDGLGIYYADKGAGGV